MQLNDQKEEFSFAFVHAVASTAGFQVELPRRDRDSVDGQIISDLAIIEFQAKATAQQVERNGEFRFPLPIKNYDDLRNPDAMALRVLVVVKMPDDPSQWLSQTDEQLCLQGHAVWELLRGRDAVGNQTSVTIPIPSTNRFDCDGLASLMETAKGIHSEPRS